MNFEDKPVKGLKALLEGFTHSYLSFLGCADAKSDCVSMWTVHSYEGDYNPLHDHVRQYTYWNVLYFIFKSTTTDRKTIW